MLDLHNLSLMDSVYIIIWVIIFLNYFFFQILKKSIRDPVTQCISRYAPITSEKCHASFYFILRVASRAARNTL